MMVALLLGLFFIGFLPCPTAASFLPVADHVGTLPLLHVTGNAHEGKSCEIPDRPVLVARFAFYDAAEEQNRCPPQSGRETAGPFRHFGVTPSTIQRANDQITSFASSERRGVALREYLEQREFECTETRREAISAAEQKIWDRLFLKGWRPGYLVTMFTVFGAGSGGRLMALMQWAQFKERFASTTGAEWINQEAASFSGPKQVESIRADAPNFQG
jgi:hypothetical protein